MTALLNSLFAALSPLWEMSLTAAYAAAVVVVLRFILKKRAPKQVLCLLWLVVFARLLVPLSLESPVSLVPNALPRQEQVQPETILPSGQGSGVQTDPAPAQPSAPAQPNGVTADPVVQGNPGPVLTVPDGADPAPEPAPASFPWRALLAGVWLAGAAAMALSGLISCLRLKSCLFDAIRARDGAWEHPAVRSPFILGLFRPRIYLPAGLTGQPRQFILCHERAHLRRLDHLVKPLCWAALALHWFNPAAWLSFILMSRDIEAACDEAVLRQLGPKVKADYSETLLALATDGRMPAPCPLAFDEGDAKNRIKNVLRYRRPALWIVVVSAVMAVMAAVCLLTDPVSAKSPDPGPDASPSASQAPDQDLNALLEPWMAGVLDGERSFLAGSEEYRIDQLRAMAFGDEFPELTLKAGKLAIMDLDKDGVNEMVVWPTDESGNTTEASYTVGYLILRRQGDAVYGYIPGSRVCNTLKADGTFTWSGSSHYWGFGSAKFTENGFEIENITWCDATGDGEQYFVNGLKVTQEEFVAATAQSEQNRKPDPVWYAYENGQLQIYRPSNLELAAETDPALDSGQAKLWRQGGEIPWLEWNGSMTQLNGLITPGQTPFIYCWDFDGDGQDEVVVTYHLNGYAQYDLYEWTSAGPAFAASYDSQQMLVRFNKNNVAAVSPHGDGYALTVNYAHVEGEDTPDSTDFYRHYVTGRCVLPGDFFDGGYEHIRDGYTYAYANGFHLVYLQRETGKFYFDFDIYLADETMPELNYVDTLLGDPLYSEYADHYMLNKAVGAGGFYLRYDGAQWRLEEFDQLTMDYGGDPSVPPSAAPEPSATPTPAPSAAPTVCEHGLEDLRLEYAGSQLTARCNQDGFTYQIPGVTSANWDGTAGQGDGAGWVKEDVDGDGYTELIVYTTDHKVVSLKMVSGTPVSSSFDLQTLMDDFNQNSTYRLDSDNEIMEVSYQGYTRQITTLDHSYWMYMMTHGGGFGPEIWPTEYWANRLSFGFDVYNGRGASLGLTALWTLSYDAGGRLQTGSFSM